MKKILLLAACYATWSAGHAQTAGGIVNYDFSKKAISGTQTIPFDKNFDLVVTRFPNGNIKYVEIYQVIYKHGRRILKGTINGSGLSLSDAAILAASRGHHLSDHQKTMLAIYLDKKLLDPDVQKKIEASQISVRRLKKLLIHYAKNYHFVPAFLPPLPEKKDSIVIVHFEPLRPARYFDITVFTGLSPANVSQLLEVNKAILTGDTAGANKMYTQLVEATRDSSYTAKRKIYNFAMREYPLYKNWFYANRQDTLYAKMLENTHDTSVRFPSALMINRLEQLLKHHKIKYPNAYQPLKIILDSTQQAVVHGLLPADYTLSASRADIFDFTKRIRNLAISKKYFDSISVIMEQAYALSADSLMKSAMDSLKTIAASITKRDSIIQEAVGAFLKSIDNSYFFTQSYTFGSDNQAADLKTKAGFKMTTDLGFTNIFAYDNRDKLNYIPKIYFGANIYFRQVDKNAELSTLKWGWSDSGLLARRNPLQYLSLSIGLTIGGMSNPDFSNLYNTFSLTAGPSFRFAHACRLTSGVAFLDRTRENPLISSKQFITGWFAAFSVDLDYLTPVQKLIDLITKP